MALDAGSVFATLGGQFNPAGFLAFDSAMKKSGAQATAFERDLGRSQARSSAAVTAFGTAAKTAGAVGVAAMGAAVIKSVQIFADYEQRLSGLKAVSGATAGEMKKLEGQSRKLGASTAFSAREVVRAQTELVKGGVSVENVLKGGVAGALALAAAGEMELADAATTVANALNVFKLEGEDAGHVADVLAQAALNTTADVSHFAMALTQGGAAAKLAGLSFDQTIVALEALAMAGVKGSDAGTSLKAALTQVASPSKESAAEMKRLGIELFDSGGKIKNVAQMSDELRDGLKGMSEEQRLATLTTIAGTDGMRALAAMYDLGSGKARELSRSHKEVGTAAEVAKEKQDNLRGDTEKLGGALEEAALQIGEKVGPEVRDAVQEITAGVQELVESGELTRFAEDLGSALGKLGTGAGAAIGAIDDVLTAYDKVRNVEVGGLKPVDLALDITTDPFDAISTAIGQIREQAGTLGPAIDGALTAAFSGAADKVMGLASSILGVFADIAEAGNDLMPGKIGDVDTSGLRDAQRDIDELRERARTPLSLKFDMQDGSRADRNIRGLIDRLDTVGKKKVAIRIAQNAPDAESAMAALAAAVQGVPTKWITRIQNNAKSSELQVTAYAAAVAGVPRSKISQIITNARSEQGAVAALQSQINGLRGKNVTVGVTISGSGKALKALGWASGRSSGERETGVVGEGGGPEWLVDSRTGRARKTSGPELVELGPDDYVIPTEQRYRGRAFGLLGMLAEDLGVSMYAKGRAAKNTGKGKNTGKSKGGAKKKAPRFIPSPRQVFRDDPDELERIADNATDKLEDAKRASTEKVTKGKNKGKLTKAAKAAKDKIPELREEARKRRKIAREAKRYADQIEAADERAEIERNNMILADRKDDGKAYNKAKIARGKAVQRSIDLLRVALKNAPKGTKWRRALEQALGESQIALDDNSREQMDVEEQEETQAERDAREAADRLADTGMTDAERAQLTEIEKDEALAALTQGLDDDKAAAGRKVSFLEGILGLVQADPARGGAAAIRDIADQVQRARGNLSSLNQTGTATNENADVQAQIEQAKQAGYAAGLGSRIDAAAAGVFGKGSGGATVIVNTLHPGDARTLDAIGAAATAGIGQQGFRRANRENIGV